MDKEKGGKESNKALFDYSQTEGIEGHLLSLIKTKQTLKLISVSSARQGPFFINGNDMCRASGRMDATWLKQEVVRERKNGRGRAWRITNDLLATSDG